MKARLFLIATLIWAAQLGEVFACATCMADKNSPTTAHMAMAIWVTLFVAGLVWSVVTFVFGSPILAIILALLAGIAIGRSASRR